MYKMNNGPAHHNIISQFVNISNYIHEHAILYILLRFFCITFIFVGISLGMCGELVINILKGLQVTGSTVNQIGIVISFLDICVKLDYLFIAILLIIVLLIWICPLLVEGYNNIMIKHFNSNGNTRAREN